MHRLVTQFAIGGAEMMRANIIEREKERGFAVYAPGEVEWFPRCDWKDSSVISVTGNRVRIVLVEARTQKGGAFRRLLHAINEMQMVPVVVEPHDRLAAVLVGWGWRHRKVGVGFEGENVWYPRP
jgi:hypothetical protein